MMTFISMAQIQAVYTLQLISFLNYSSVLFIAAASCQNNTGTR